MSDILRPITNHSPSRLPVLDLHDAQRVEARLLTYEQARYETAARLRIENALLREQVERLAADNAALAIRIEDLEAENSRLSATAKQAIDQAAHEHERLVVAEQGHTLWLGGLALVTVAAVVWLITVLR